MKIIIHPVIIAIESVDDYCLTTEIFTLIRKGKNINLLFPQIMNYLVATTSP